MRRAETRGRAPVDIKNVEEVLDEYFSESPYDFSKDTAAIMSLCRLYSQVSHFLNDYYMRATRLLTAPVNPVKPNKVSKPEFGDLSLIDNHASPHAVVFDRAGPPPEGLLPVRIFLSSFPAIRVGSLGHFRRATIPAGRLQDGTMGSGGAKLCPQLLLLHNYLLLLARGFVEDMEAQLLEAVFSSPGAQIQRKVQSENGNARYCAVKRHDGTSDAPREERMVPFGDPPPGVLELYHGVHMRRVPRFTSKLATYGLGFIRKLQVSDPNERKDTIWQEDFHARDSLAEAPRLSPLAPNGAAAQVSFQYTEGAFVDDISGANLGFHLRRTYVGSPWVHFRILPTCRRGPTLQTSGRRGKASRSSFNGPESRRT